MIPIAYFYIFAVGFIIGFAMSRWSDTSDMPKSEDHVSDECLRSIVRKTGRS